MLQIQLAADYCPSALLGLLSAPGATYPLEEALSVCEAKGRVPEQVYILARMGCAGAALRLIIDRLGDIPQALEFVASQRDDELWGSLIDWALQSPETTGEPRVLT